VPSSSNRPPQDARQRWQRPAAVAALVAVVAVGFFVLRTPEPTRTAFALAESVCADRAQRPRELRAHVAERVTFEIEDDEHGWSKQRISREELSAQLEQLDLAWPNCQLQLEAWSVQSPAAGSEWLDGQLELSQSQVNDLHAEVRSVHAEFRIDGELRRLERVRLGAAERRLPEPRP
jgi:hypothetical protein